MGVQKTLLKMQFDWERKLQIAGESQCVMSSVSTSVLRRFIRIIKWVRTRCAQNLDQKNDA